ncbi:DUF3169 family protein [Bacillus alkalicola]|uniref:DUF3169 family protein n=1 Tax=Evansella alkalicola TaxID=745819 RepID=A0ABS6JY29_9BACI|nr:DUF3169 family protein [Bacillus alkalicola]MBU9723493.1 DUF3169 family protein [Bacillus alkalicola]
MNKLAQLVYRDRSQSNPTSNHAKTILDFADDGEKHVILGGLYKAYGFLNICIFAAIALSTVYSITGGSPQTFSIILMALILLTINTTYLVVVRNK